MSSPTFKAFPDHWDMESITEHVIIHYRWVFVMFLLPISLCYDIYSAVRNYVVFTMSSAPTKHLEKVKDVQRQVKDWQDLGSVKPMCTARPGWQTISPQNMDYKKRMHGISVNLVDILDINVDKR